MWRRTSAGALALILAACAAPTPFDLYQETHPGWQADFPRAGIGHEETVASIYAPHQIERGSITEVRKLREVPGAGPSASQLVIVAHVFCAAPKPLGWFYNDAVSWYLLRDGKLAAWRHFAFQEFCHGTVVAEPIGAEDELARGLVTRALASVVDPAGAAALVTAEPAQPPAPPDPAAETACPGTGAFRDALRAALEREPTIHTYFVGHDLVLTIAIEPDGGFELEKIRPTDFFARQMVQQVRRVSASPERPRPPECLLGKSVELAYPR